MFLKIIADQTENSQNTVSYVLKKCILKISGTTKFLYPLF